MPRRGNTQDTHGASLARRRGSAQQRHQPLGEQEVAQMIAREGRLIPFRCDDELAANAAGIVEQGVDLVGETANVRGHARRVRHQ